MNMRRALYAGTLAGLSAACAANVSSACTCVDINELRDKESKAGRGSPKDEDILRARFEKAIDVVRGKIISMRAGKDVQSTVPSANGIHIGPNGNVNSFTSFSGARRVVGTMMIATVLKGTLSGEIEITTGFGTGDCGIPDLFLVSIAWDREVEVEVFRNGKNPETYSVNMCGYGKILPAPPASSPQR